MGTAFLIITTLDGLRIGELSVISSCCTFWDGLGGAAGVGGRCNAMLFGWGSGIDEHVACIVIVFGSVCCACSPSWRSRYREGDLCRVIDVRVVTMDSWRCNTTLRWVVALWWLMIDAELWLFCWLSAAALFSECHCKRACCLVGHQHTVFFWICSPTITFDTCLKKNYLTKLFCVTCTCPETKKDFEWTEKNSSNSARTPLNSGEIVFLR